MEPLKDSLQVAEMLNISNGLVHKLAKSGELPHYRVGNLLRFSDDQIKTFLDSQTNGETK
jgi:excisionase family DNA binding protein